MNILTLHNQSIIRSLFTSSSIFRNFSSSNNIETLFARISPLGDQNKFSVIPVLDQWFREGKKVEKAYLRILIEKLKKQSRFKQALEVSHWMSERMYIPLCSGAVAERLTLIWKIHGIEQAESYFSNIPKQLKGFKSHIALLNCYVHVTNVEKAEALVQKIGEMGFSDAPVCYNYLLDLYRRTQNYSKLDSFMLEMEGKGICYSIYTFGICLAAYAAACDSKGIDKMVKKMEISLQQDLDWKIYAIAADGYLKVGLIDKATTMLKTCEGLITFKCRIEAFNSLLNLYAKIGEKDEIYRIWNLYKEMGAIYNKGYRTMISSLLSLDEVDGAEKIFDDWKSRELVYDIRISKLLIEKYCRIGLLGKAESLMDHAQAKGAQNLVDGWCSLANGLLEVNQIPKAMEAMKKAFSVCEPGRNPSKETLATCLEYLEGKGDVEQAGEFINQLKVERLFSEASHSILLNHVQGRNL